MSRVCIATGKDRFESRKDAMAGLHGRMRAGAYKQREMAAYRCAECGGWHHGHRATKLERARKRLQATPSQRMLAMKVAAHGSEDDDLG